MTMHRTFFGFSTSVLIFLILLTTSCARTSNGENNKNASQLFELKYDIKTGGPSFNCAKGNLNEAEEVICRSWQLSYLDRNSTLVHKGAIFAAKPDHVWTLTMLERQKQWEAKRNSCQTEDCVGNVYIQRLCSWQADKFLIWPPVDAKYNKKFFHVSEHAVIAESIVFQYRYMYLCNRPAPSWQNFLKLIAPYQPVKKAIKDIHFDMTLNLYGAEDLVRNDVCQAFTALLNAHKNKQDLLCHLPDMSSNPDFSPPHFRSLTLDEEKRYKRFLYHPENLKISNEQPEIGYWPALLRDSSPAFQENVLVLKKPQHQVCPIREQINEDYSFFARPFPEDGDFFLEEVLRTELPLGNYDYTVLYPEQNTTGEIASGHLFLYQGITYSYNFFYNAIFRFNPMYKDAECTITPSIQFDTDK